MQRDNLARINPRNFISRRVGCRRLILIGALTVWLLFIASFVMPVAKGGRMLGWQAFGFYLAAMWDVPEYWRQITHDPSALWVSTFPSTNGGVFIAPLVLFRWPRWSGALGCALMLGGLVPALGFFEMVRKNQLRVGFYCWVASIFLMAFLCFCDWICQRRDTSCHSEPQAVVR